jgi:hypothetical protein
MNVPRKANVRMEPKLRKKFSYRWQRFIPLKHEERVERTYLFQLIARVQNDGRKEEVEEERVLESLGWSDQ